MGVDKDRPVWSWVIDSQSIYSVENTVADSMASIEENLKTILVPPIDAGATPNLRDYIVKHMPAQFKKQYFQVKGRDIQEDAEHVYECGLGAFLLSAIKQLFLIQFFKNFAFALTSQFLIHYHNNILSLCTK